MRLAFASLPDSDSDFNFNSAGYLQVFPVAICTIVVDFSTVWLKLLGSPQIGGKT